MSIFRAYDIRGIVGETLTSDIVYDIGRAVGSEAEQHDCGKIAVARDGRLSGPELLQALISGLTETGREVIDVGRVPTPVLYFAAHAFAGGSGVMITGSHNPPEYNGLKMMIGGDTLSGEWIQKLKQRIDNGDFHRGEGRLEKMELAAAYLAKVHESLNINKQALPLKVVVDCGSGAAGELAPRLLRELGCDVFELFCEIDGNFPHHHPDPSKPENLQDLVSTVQQQKADLGLAFDGDGDRLGVVDCHGKVIWPDRQLILYAQDILQRQPGATILYDVKCSRHLGAAIEKAGGKPLMWKTGHSFMKSKLKESGALLAGEMSGHIFFKERWYGFDDALYTAARLIEILSHADKTPAEVFAQLPETVSTPELQIQMREGEHFDFMRRFAENARFDGAQIFDIDGIRADFSNGWGLVRPSNTTPCLVLRFEADNMAALVQVQECFRKQLLALDDTLKLPF